MTSWRRRTDHDFGDEVQAHLDLEAERLIEEGMPPEEARAAARRAFGNVTAARERFHESTRWIWVEQFQQDLRYAARGLARSPTFVATAVVTLAVGLGLLTVAFTVFNAYVLRPFAVRDPASLYRLQWQARGDGGQAFAWRDFEELRGRTDLFDAVVAEESHFVASHGQNLAVDFVSDNYFSALAPRMRLGRGLSPADAQQPVAVLSQQAWTRLFSADPNALGQTVDLDGHALTVVGVVAPEFGGLDDYPRDVWAIFGVPPSNDRPRPVEITVRVPPHRQPAQIAAQLATFAARAAPANVSPGDLHAVLVPNATATPLSWDLIAILAPVFAAFVLVLVTACANVSNVMLARAVARQREIAVRLSLGASRGRIVRQLLTEGLLLAVLAAGTALALAAWVLRAATLALFSTLPPSLATLLRIAPMPLDYRVFLFALAAATAATLVFALLPALHASRQPLTAALHGQRSGTREASRTRSALVVAQVALSILLVVCALVLARNFKSVGAIDLGYRTAGVYSINVRGDVPGAVSRAAQALAQDPQIATVAVTGGNPLFNTHFAPAGPGGTSRLQRTRYRFVSPQFFDVLQIPLTRGRMFRSDELHTGSRVVIVSDATASVFWPGADPIGQTIRFERSEQRTDDLADRREVTVIGTVPDVVSGLMLEGKDDGHVYLPLDAADTRADAMLIAPRAGAFRPETTREIFRRLGYDPETFEVIPMNDIRAAQVYPLRAAAWIGGLLGGVALLLSISGLYGVLSYMLSQRTREIGIRMALGATARAVVGLILRQSLRLAGAGAIAGLVMAATALKVLSSLVQLDAVSLLDATPFAVGAVVVLAATALAAYQPARRATKVDPAETLRAEA
jgi:predicted permease